MTTLVRWDPFNRNFNALTHGLDRFFESAFTPSMGRDVLGSWNPAVDIVDHGTEVILKAELPGMKKKEIEIHVENNVLTLRGERKREEESKENGYVRSERSYGSFTRSFTLPGTVDVKNIAANYRDGILSVTLPKAEEAKPRQIEVKVA